MKTIRQLLAGSLIGGAFGAKVGAYMSSISEAPNSLIYSGLAFGAGAGLLIVLSMALANQDFKLPRTQWSFKKRDSKKQLWDLT